MERQNGVEVQPNLLLNEKGIRSIESVYSSLHPPLVLVALASAYKEGLVSSTRPLTANSTDLGNIVEERASRVVGARGVFRKALEPANENVKEGDPQKNTIKAKIFERLGAEGNPIYRISEDAKLLRLPELGVLFTTWFASHDKSGQVISLFWRPGSTRGDSVITAERLSYMLHLWLGQKSCLLPEKILNGAKAVSSIYTSRSYETKSDRYEMKRSLIETGLVLPGTKSKASTLSTNGRLLVEQVLLPHIAICIAPEQLKDDEITPLFSPVRSVLYPYDKQKEEIVQKIDTAIRKVGQIAINLRAKKAEEAK